MTLYLRSRPARQAAYTDPSIRPGLPGQARSLTATGACPVQQLKAGDRVVTRDGGLTALIGLYHVIRWTDIVAFHRLAVDGAGGLITTVLPADQPVLVRDWRAPALFGATQALVAAHRLIDEEFVPRRVPPRMTLYTLHLAAPAIIYVAGMELGSAGPMQDMTRDARPDG